MFDKDWLLNTILILPGILIALSVHEFSHGMVAYLMGDDTAKNQGRLTLLPHTHIDPFGFFMLMFAKIGWAKPVPVNPNNFKNRKLGMLLVSLAGPASNFILAIIFVVLLELGAFNFNEAVFWMGYYGFVINVGLCVFNLLPFPPLDGSKIVASFLPEEIEFKFYQYERYLYGFLLILLITDKIDLFLDPMRNGVYKLISHMVQVVL